MKQIYICNIKQRKEYYPKMIKVYAHSSLSSFFSDLKSDLKKRRVSLRNLSSQLGCSVSTLSETFNLKVKMSHDISRKIAVYYSFSAQELEYIMALIDLHFEDSYKIKKHAQSVIHRLKDNKNRPKIASEETLRFYLSSHLPSVIVELVALFPKGIEPDFMKKLLDADDSLINFCLDKLFISEMLLLKENKLYSVKSNYLVDFKLENFDSIEYYQNMFKVIVQKIKSTSKDQRFIATETFTFESDKIEQVKRILNKAIDEVMSLSDPDKKNSVYHLNLSLVPLVSQIDRK